MSILTANHFVRKTGDIMSGNLVMDAGKTVDGIDVSADLLKKSGGQMTGDITMAGSQQVDGVDLSTLKTKNGTPLSRNTNTVYQAAEDGFLFAKDDGGTSVLMYWDTFSSPTTIRGTESGSQNCVGCVIKKDIYYKMWSSAGVVLWTPKVA